MTQPRLPIGVAAYSFPCGCGFVRRNGDVGSPPLDAWALMRLAREHGLASVELPLAGLLADTAATTIGRLRTSLREYELELVVDTGVVDADELNIILPLAAAAGARTVRATLSTILEGARGGLLGSWEAHLDLIRKRIAAIRPSLEALGLTLALENHQDATADDLLMLCESGGERVGVTFDVVNPLAVGEDPFAFARKLGPYIRNVHLKDYRVYATPAGYRLVRCALGEGVIDWQLMLSVLDAAASGAPRQIELAALYGRHIRLLEDDWWAAYPARNVHEFVPALRLLARHARPEVAAWQTPWELGLPAEAVMAYEMDQFERSVAHLRALAR